MTGVARQSQPNRLMDSDADQGVRRCEPGRAGRAAGHAGITGQQQQPKGGRERYRPQAADDEADDDRGGDQCLNADRRRLAKQRGPSSRSSAAER